MLTGHIFWIFFLFNNFWTRLFFPLVDNKDYYVLCKMGYRKGASFLLSFSLLPCCLKSYCFQLFLWDSHFSCMLLLVFLEIRLISLGLICKIYQCSSMIFLTFGKVLLNFSTSGVLGLFAIFVLKLIKRPLLLLIFV